MVMGGDFHVQKVLSSNPSTRNWMEIVHIEFCKFWLKKTKNKQRRDPFVKISGAKRLDMFILIGQDEFVKIKSMQSKLYSTWTF